MTWKLTDQEMEQGWAEVPLHYGGQPPAGLPSSIRLVRPGSRRGVHLFSNWTDNWDNLIFIDGCLPVGQPAGEWLEHLSATGFQRLSAAAFELVLGRAFAAKLLEGVPAPVPMVEQAAAQLRVDPLRQFSQLSPVQSEGGQVDIPLEYYLGRTPAGLPDRVLLTLPVDLEKQEIAAGYERHAIRERNFYLIKICLPLQWRSEELLDVLSIPTIYRLADAAWELCLGREAMKRILEERAARLTKGGLLLF